MGLQDEVKKRVETEQPQKSVDDRLEDWAKKQKEFKDRTNTWFRGFLRILPLILINVLGLFIVGADNFVEGTWTWGIFLTASFWYSYISYQTANWLIAITWFVNKIKSLKKTKKQYNDNIAFIQEMVDKDHEEEFIQKQVDVESLRRKKETLELQVYEKMYHIRNTNHIKSVEDFLKKADSGVFVSTFKPKSFKYRRDIKRQVKAYKKLSKLNEMLTFDWQKEYLQSYNIDYTKVTRELIVSGITPRNRKGRYNDYKTRFGSTSFKAIVPSAIATSVLGLILLAFQFVFREATLATWIKFGVQIMLIIWNTMMVVMTAYDVFDGTIENALEQRRSDLGLFKKRSDTGNQDTQDVIKLLDYNKEKSVA